MENKRIHSVTGLFKTPNDIIHAAQKTAEKFKFFDVNTPYPVHGMNDAMKLKPSAMGYFALAFGLTGAVVALLFISFTSVLDYPMNIGGKPSFSLPAFIPVMFEVTVLFAVIGTVIGMLFVFFKMPDNSNPLHDSNYMKRCTSDLFGVCIEAKNKDFTEDDAKAFLTGLGAVEIETIYYEETTPPPIFSKQFIGFLLGAAIALSGVAYFATNKLVFMEPFNWMSEQQRIDVQEKSDFWGDGFGMREAVAGTVARNFIPEEFKNSPDSAGMLLVNPLPADENIINKGKEKFQTFCSPCHGNFGKGDSRLRGLFPEPPTLHSKKAREWQDGRIYHIITYGQGIMPEYAKQLSRDERWAVIHYIRTLQRAFNPKEEDFNAEK